MESPMSEDQMEDFSNIFSTAYQNFQTPKRSKTTWKPKYPSYQQPSPSRTPRRKPFCTFDYTLIPPQYPQQQSNSNKYLFQPKQVSDLSNKNSLKLQLKKLYKQDPEVFLKRLFHRTNRANSSRISSFQKKVRMPLFKKPLKSLHKKKASIDSQITQIQADINLKEVRQVSEKRTWKQTMLNVHQSPKSPIYLNHQDTPKLLASIKIPTAEKQSNFIESHQTTPDVVYQFQNTVQVSEDWSKSLLYCKFKKKQEDFGCLDGYNQSEVKAQIKKVPFKMKALKMIRTKALNTLRMLLSELLGTKKDLDKFIKIYNCSNLGVKAMLNKCLNLFDVRAHALLIFKKLEQRQKKLHEMGHTPNKKPMIVKLFKINFELRRLIKKWGRNPFVPYISFTFKGGLLIDQIETHDQQLQKYLMTLN